VDTTEKDFENLGNYVLEKYMVQILNLLETKEGEVVSSRNLEKAYLVRTEMEKAVKIANNEDAREDAEYKLAVMDLHFEMKERKRNLCWATGKCVYQEEEVKK